jgi:hypothetical protein
LTADSTGIDGRVSSEIQVEREALFTRMASAFARRDFDAVAGGVLPEVVLSLKGSSWLAGTYRGYEEFSHYVSGARLVLEPAGNPITYLHHGDEMVVMHEFQARARSRSNSFGQSGS